MKRDETEFSRLKSVRVLVEERKVALQMTPDTWRSYEFSGLETVPEKLRPAFVKDDGENLELDLLELVRKSYRSGRVENRFEAPYRLTKDSKASTVLRSVFVTCQYRKQANAARACHPKPYAVFMPMVIDGSWPRVETDRLEAELGRKFPRLSTNLVALVVRLAKLDLRPRVGLGKLRREAEAMLERRTA